MKLLNRTFQGIEEIVEFVKNNKNVRERWYEKDIIVTLDKQFQIKVYGESNDYEDSFMKIDLYDNGEDVGILCVDHVKYIIGKFNPKMNKSIARINMYQISNAITKLFEAVLIPGDKFVYDKPCNGRGGYDIYAIANVNGMIMAEFILNSTKSMGSDEHTIGTKGLESMAIMEAWQKYEDGEGTMEYKHEYVDANLEFVI